MVRESPVKVHRDNSTRTTELPNDRCTAGCHRGESFARGLIGCHALGLPASESHKDSPRGRQRRVKTVAAGPRCAHREGVTLLDHLPSLRCAAAQRIDAAEWPRTAAVDELGRLCIGGVALSDLADEFGTPAYVVDEADFRHRLHRCRADSPRMVPIVAGTSLPTTVMRWIDDEGLGMALRGATELAVAHAARVCSARLVLHACGLHHDELTACAQAGPGRIVVDSPLDVAYLGGIAQRGQRIVIRAIGAGPDPATVDRVLLNPDLHLVGLHSGATNVELGIRGLVASMAKIRRGHGTILTEVSLTVASGTLEPSGSVQEAIEEALDEGCAAFRFPRPRVVVENRSSPIDLASVSVHRVTSVVTPPVGPRMVVIDGRITESVRGPVVLANRHPLSVHELVTVSAADTVIADDVVLPRDIHPGDVLAIASGTLGEGVAISARKGLAHRMIHGTRIEDALRRDVNFHSAGGGHHQHRGG